jgi:hypothetical protein
MYSDRSHTGRNGTAFSPLIDTLKSALRRRADRIAVAPDEGGDAPREPFVPEPLDPVNDLGCASFDAPIELAAEKEETPPQDRPRDISLTEFGQMAGRNGAYVEEPPSELPGAAMKKLRTADTAELSLLAMVERFAAALHQRQASEEVAPRARDADRDTALAEALRGLALFTEAGFDEQRALAPVQHAQGHA